MRLSYAYSRSQPKVYAADQLLSVASQDVTSAQAVDPNQIDFRTSFYAAVGNTPGDRGRGEQDQKLGKLSVEYVQDHDPRLRRPTPPASSR